MEFYFAPMEGITDHVFRNIHHKYFPGIDKYFTPFFSPTNDGRFPPRNLRDFDPAVNKGLRVVPQLLTKRGEDFNWAARTLAELGYEEINLNLGCPSGTVVAKGKGSGLLSDLEALAALLDAVYTMPAAAISVKTRLGGKDPGEFPKLLELFNRYPISQLTVHCRVREDMYRRPAQPEAFGVALRESGNPVCYNGDLMTAEACLAFQRRYPDAPAVMLGRGLVADPALVRRVQGGPPADRETLKSYLEELYEGYCSAFGNRRSALGRMKEIWFYHIALYEGAERYEKRLKKATDPGEYQGLVARVLGELPLREEGAVPIW